MLSLESILFISLTPYVLVHMAIYRREIIFGPDNVLLQ